MPRVMNRLDQRGAHQRGAADHAIETREVRHFDDRRYAAPFVANHDAVGIEEFDLAADVRAVSELVLELLDLHGILRSIRRETWDVEAGNRSVFLGVVAGARQNEMGVALGCREEPLMADQPILTAPSAC